MIRPNLALLFAVTSCNGLFAQVPQIRTVANVGGSRSAVAPGSLAVISGSNLGPASAVLTQAPTLNVTVNGVPAYVFFSSATQVNIQIPYEVSPGTANLVVSYQGQTSAAFAFTVLAYAPELFVFAGSGGGIGLFLHVNGTFISGSSPAQPGETIPAVLTGLGQTSPPAKSGQPGPISPLAVTLVQPQITVGGKPALVRFSGLAPGQIGTYQVNFTVPGDLAPGLYPVVISAGGLSSAPVVLPVSTVGIVLDRTGATIDAVQGAGAPRSTPIFLYNDTGVATASVTARASTTSGGAWLSIAPGAASVDSVGSQFSVAVNQTGLAPGNYYGQVEFDSAQAINSPQFATIVLRVSPNNAPPPPLVDTTGITLIGVAGSALPVSQSVTLTNIGSRASAFTATLTSAATPNPFSVATASGTIPAGNSIPIAVRATATGLAAGTYRGTLTFTFPLEGGTRTVDLVFIVTAGGPVTLPAAAGICKPTKLNPVFRSLGAGFNSPIAWPSFVEVFVADDCGTPMATGSVVVTFSNGDAPLALVGDGAGRWSATWTPQNGSKAPAQVTATASQPDIPLNGQVQISGTVSDNAGVPVITPGGVIDGASYSTSGTPSPGQIVAIFGAQFAPDLTSAQALPFPANLGGLQFTISGRKIPLIFVGPGQANAILPYGLPVGNAQVVAQRGTLLSTPVPVAVSSGEPGVFATAGNGQGQGHVYVAGITLADSSNPIKAGDAIVIYCGGLGEVSPAVDAGTATPGDALRKAKNTVGLTIGGVSARVDFAGLTPGSAGLYQINATVPAGITPGTAVPLVVEIGAVFSPPVTVAVK